MFDSAVKELFVQGINGYRIKAPIMKVIHINFDYAHAGVGGASIAASRLHDGLLRRGLDSTFFCSFKKTQGSHVMEVPPSETLYRVCFLFLTKILRNIWKFTRFHRAISLNVVPSGMARRINHEHPDIVHVHWVNADTVTFSELTKIRAPLVITLHDLWLLNGFDPHPKKDLRWRIAFNSKNSTFFERWLFSRKLALSRARRIHFIAPSKWVSDMCHASVIGQKQSVVVIPNPIDTSLFHFYPEMKKNGKKFIILFGCYGGSRNPYKGFDDLCASLRLLEKVTAEQVEVHVFGEQSVDYFVNGVRIHFLGAITDVHELVEAYHSGNMFAFPSKEETQGQTKIEAMACGLPVVAFDRTACAEGVVHKQNGWIAPDGDYESFKDGIMWAFRNFSEGAVCDEKRRQISARCCAEYCEENVVTKMIAFYHDVVKQSRVQVMP